MNLDVIQQRKNNLTAKQQVKEDKQFEQQFRIMCRLGSEIFEERRVRSLVKKKATAPRSVSNPLTSLMLDPSRPSTLSRQQQSQRERRGERAERAGRGDRRGDRVITVIEEVEEETRIITRKRLIIVKKRWSSCWRYLFNLFIKSSLFQHDCAKLLYNFDRMLIFWYFSNLSNFKVVRLAYII